MQPESFLKEKSPARNGLLGPICLLTFMSRRQSVTIIPFRRGRIVGLVRYTRNVVWAQVYRGFESLPLRQPKKLAATASFFGFLDRELG